jgi:hypothetical protein
LDCANQENEIYGAGHPRFPIQSNRIECLTKIEPALKDGADPGGTFQQTSIHSDIEGGFWIAMLVGVASPKVSTYFNKKRRAACAEVNP